MTSELNTCSRCGTIAEEGQKFCGDCGQLLKSICMNCDTTNPPIYRFCGQCGKNLRDIGTVLLDQTGLIVQMDNTASNILNQKGDSVVGKPFSIFVAIADRVIFFSHWNMLLKSTTPQEFHVELALTKQTNLYCHLLIKTTQETRDKSGLVQMEIDDVTDNYHIVQQLEENENLLTFIGYLGDIFHPTKIATREKTITTVLEKICILSSGSHGFIARIDQEKETIATEFAHNNAAKNNRDATCHVMELSVIKSLLDKLHKEHSYCVDDLKITNPAEREMWKKWHGISDGSILCELMYSNNIPIGILGVIRSSPAIWSRNVKSLINLAGQLIAGSLPYSLPGNTILKHSPSSVLENLLNGDLRSPSRIDEIDEVEIIIDTKDDRKETKINKPKKMMIEPTDLMDHSGAMPIFATNEGMYALRCPKCSRQEFVSVTKFDENGWILKVTCPCTCSFRIIREMRKTFRKNVQLDGLFSRNGEDLNKLVISNGWSAIEITNISKNGVNFQTPQSRLLQTGDTVQLRFNLDNRTKSAIKKSATVRSVRDNNVGCQFLGQDKYDITLGFYFL